MTTTAVSRTSLPPTPAHATAYAALVTALARAEAAADGYLSVDDWQMAPDGWPDDMREEVMNIGWMLGILRRQLAAVGPEEGDAQGE